MAQLTVNSELQIGSPTTFSGKNHESLMLNVFFFLSIDTNVRKESAKDALSECGFVMKSFYFSILGNTRLSTEQKIPSTITEKSLAS